MAVPTSSAVLLMHNPHGGFPIAAAGGLSRQAAHALDYDGREGEYEEKGGCDREPTERDRDLATSRALSGDATRHLDYTAREGNWADGAREMTEDCSYWGQNGPLARDDIERDMLACGGCYLKSVVSVDRRYAAELGLDSKAAFQELMRANWQNMMATAGAAAKAADVHWYACYHTDAQNSLHVHVATWAADGRIEEGWHPSARATREQKAILYRDAYAPIRLQRDLERDYYRMLLPRLAAVEMGGRVSEGDAERLRVKAERAGVEEIPLRKTLDEKGSADVGRKAQAVADRLGAGRGLKAKDWKLQSDAGKVVKALSRHSAPFDAALARYRQIAESKADMAGLSTAEKAHDPDPGPATKAARERAASAHEIVTRERNRFVRREMDDVMRRIRNQVIRTAGPDGRVRELTHGDRVAPSRSPSGSGSPRTAHGPQLRPQTATSPGRSPGWQGQAEQEQRTEHALGAAGIAAAIAAAIVRDRGEAEGGGKAAKGARAAQVGQEEGRAR